MRRVLLLSAIVFCFTASAKVQSSKPTVKAQGTHPAATASPSPAAVKAARASFAKLPLSFEENVGQADSRVKYTSRGAGYNLFLTADEAVFALRSGSASSNCAGLAEKIHPDCADSPKHVREGSVLWLKMVGANSSAQILGSEPLPGKINYYIGNDPSKWRTGVRQFGRVSYRKIYPGVDLTYYGNQQQLESDFVVAPGSSPRSIEFEVKGARESRLDARGNLILVTAAGDVQLLRPGVYQTVKGVRRDISGRYVIRGKDRVGLDIGSYDRHNPLIIDPIFVYSTYLGGSATFSGDTGNAIAIDSTGSAYVTGSGESVDFPGSALTGPVSEAIPFAFVTKFDPNGNTLVYSTLLRGTQGSNDSGNGIGLDSSNHAYVAGVTSDSDFPLLNPFQATLGDLPLQSNSGFIQSGFVAGLQTDGTLIYSTYFGGQNYDDFTYLTGLAADSVGNAYVVGYTSSQNFPTINPLQAVNKGYYNPIVAKFNGQGQPVYSTYLGGSVEDYGYAITVDTATSPNAYITGETYSTDFPVQTAPVFQAANNGGADAFVSKLSFNTTSQTLTLAASTYLGGNGTDVAYGIAVDTASTPNVYLTGQTTSTIASTGNTPFPTLNPIFGPQTCSAGSCTEAFVTKMKGDFTALIYSTFLGGTGGDSGNALAIDGAIPPNTFVTGSTTSSNFPILNPLQSSLDNPTTTDAFITEVNGAGSALTYSTYLGGFAADVAHGIAVDSTGNAYVAGTTLSANFPVFATTGAPFQSQLRSSSGNAFVTKISPNVALSGLYFFPPAYNYHGVGVGASALEYVTLSNNSSSSVTINSFSFTGTNSGDFTLQAASAPCTVTGSFVLPAAPAATSSCTLTIKFAPADQDTRSATLTINSTPPSSTTMNLTGFGAVPEVSLSQTTINFGTNDPLDIATPNAIEITNTGGATLLVGSIQISSTGTDASAFNVTFNDCTSVLPNQSCFIELSFTPTVAGHAYSATLTINDNAAGSPRSIPMTGTGVGQVIVSPTSAEFGGWLVGTSSPDHEFYLTNGSGGNITLGASIAPGGADPGDFPVDVNYPYATTYPICTANLVMLPGVTCIFNVYFHPTAGSAIDGRTATYTFSWTGTLTGSQAITLMGAGETGVTLYTNSVTAPSVYLGETERQVDFDMLYNGTTSPITVTGIVLSGANPQDFAVQLDNSCSINGVVPANSTCYLDGAFSPSALGTRSVTATISYTPPSGSSLTLNATGTGIPGPVIFPGALSFGSQIVGLTMPTQRVVLQNVSKVPLAISTVSPPTGTNASDFTIAGTSTCTNGVNVPGGGKCYLDLTFTPGATGSRTATITVTDNGPGSPRTLTLTGTGEPGSETISVSPAVVDFGNVPLVGPGLTQPTLTASFYLTNGGNTTTTITAAPVALTAPFGLVTGGTCVLNQTVLPQGGTCSVTVSFKPTTTGQQSTTETLSDSLGGQHSVTIQGAGVDQGALSLSSPSVFYQTPGSTTATPQTVTVTNTGSGPLTVTVLSLTGASASDFAIAPSPATTCAPGTTGVTLAAAPGPGNTCVIGVTFTAPSTVGTYSADVLVSATLGNNATKSSTASLSGDVVSGGLGVSPAPPMNFGTVAIGTSLNFSTINGNNYITLTNNNVAPVTISSVAPQTTGDFTVQSNSCLVTLSVNSTCIFDVAFAPMVNAAETNNIVVTYAGTGATGNPLSIPVKGTGSNALVATPNPVNLSTTVGFTLNPTVTIGNGSSSTATIVSVSSFSGTGAPYYSLSFDACTGLTLPASGTAGNSCQIYLVYAPTAPGTNVPAQFTVTYTVGASSTQQTLQVNLSGTAAAPQVSVVPSGSTPLVFPNTLINTQSLVLDVVVTNTGTGSSYVYFSGLKITGANANDFSFAPPNYNSGPGMGCQYNELLPGQSCTIPLIFTPSLQYTSASRNATLTITDNAYPSATQTVLLEGNITGGNVFTSTTSLTFPPTNIGSSVTEDVLLTNTSSSPITFNSVAFTGPYASGTGPNGCASGQSVGAFTGSCVIYITFTPTALANPGTATVHYNGTSTLPMITLSGAGSNPSVNVSPTSLTFSAQTVGTASSPQTVTLSNPTSSVVTVSGTPAISGTNASDFRLGTNSCTNGTNLPATTGSCVVNVIFNPGSTGGTARTATLSISDTPNDAASPHTVTLNGTAIQPVAGLSGTTMAFGSLDVGLTSAQQTVTLTNTGNATLTISDIALGGTNPTDFAFASPATTCPTGTTGGQLTAGSSCVVAATFTPTATGSRSATITITDNATPATQVINLSGTGTQPAVSLLPTTISFGNQLLNKTSAQSTSTLTNSGTGPLTITSVTLTGTNPGDFALATPGSGSDCRTVGTVAAGGTCTIAATFTPTALGSRSATVSVADSAAGSPHTLPLTGTGVFPQATPTPSPVAFGNQMENVTSAAQTLTLTNGGTATLNLTTVVLGGTNANQFAIATGTTCTNGSTVAAGATCVVNLTFTPTALGLQTATVTFTDDASPTTQVVTLTGTGVFPQATPTPSPVAFGNQRENVTSAAQTLTLTNGGTGTLTLTTVALGGTNANQFAIATGTTCTNGSTVLAGATCVVKLTFTPTGLGSQTATVTFTDNASPTTQVVTLTGTGVFPQASPAPTTVAFGSQTNGITSGPQTVTLTNGGTGTLDLTTVALGGTNPGAFAIAAGTTCTNGSTVLAGASCVVNVTFTPTGLTSFSATLTFTDDANPTTQVVNLTGTGVTSTVNFSPSTVAFGNQREGTPSAQMTSTLTNSGATTLTITSVTLTGTNQGDFALATPGSGSDCRTVGTVAAGGTCTIAATFTPTALGSRSATVSVADNASGSPHTLPLTGTGVFPQATPTPSPVAFGNQMENVTSAAQTLTLTNGGTGTLTLTTVVLGGTNANQFAIATGTTCTNGSTVAAGATCVVNLTFTPTALGLQTATVTFTDDASPTTQVVTLTGTGVFPQATPTPSPVAFGNQRENVTSAAQTLTLTNGGTGTLTLTTVALGGTNANQFAIATGTTCTNGSTVLAGATCVVKLTFTPTGLGSQTATVTFTDNASPTTQVVTLTGTGVFPQASPAPTTVAFGSQTNGITGGPQTVTLTNGGTGTLDLTTVALGGSNPGAFAIAAGTTCTNGSTVLAGASCVVNVTFTPTGLTSFSATLTFTDDANPTTQVVNLTGTGVTSTVNFSPSTVAFGNQREGTPSAQMTSTLTNSGATTLTITSVTLTGTNQGDFALATPGSGSDCRTVGTVAAGGTCTIAATFTPTALGSRSATVSVADSAAGSPHTLPLTGTGVFPQATPTPSPVAFGNQMENVTSAAQTLTLTNGGTGTLTLTTVVLGGTNANQFAIATGTTCTNGSTVLAGATCVVNLTFTPTALGLQTATVTFTDDASPTTQVVTLTGTGVFPQATPTPSPMAFGNQRENVTSAAQTLTLTNGGTGTLTLTTVALGGTNANQFAIATGTTCTNGSTVLAGATCVVKLTFTPTGLGSQTATVTFTDNASPTTQVVTLTGTGVFPQASPAPTTVAFGSQTNGITSGPQTVTLTNGGTGTLDLTTVALGGTNPGAFAIAAGTTCTNGSTVLAGASCVVNVTFTPTGLTSFSATLTFTDDANPTTQVVNLTGTGVTSTVNFSPSTVAFGNQREGTPSAQMTSTLTNSGATTLTITSVTLTGTNQGDFALATPGSGSDCRTVGTVAAGGTCTIAATFTPTALGSRSATVSVADNASGSPHTLPLTGTGVFPQATPTPSPLAFGNQIINTTSTVQTVTLTNSGTDVLNITTVALGGTNPADFAIATGTTCTNGSTVAAGSTCIVNLTFTPVTANPFAATLTFTDDANPTTQTVNLSGTGVTPPTATLSANSINFSNQRVGTTSAAQNVTITNNGGAPLNVTSITISGTNASEFAFASPATTCPTSTSGQVAPAASCTLSVTFSPTAINAQSASINIVVNGIANPSPITLSGTGIEPSVQLAPATVPFGNQEVSTSSAAQNGTLTNNGTDVLHITAVAITGTNASDFSIVTTGTSCASGLPTPVTVTATTNCTWSVKFTPTALGARTASLTFTDDNDAVAGSTQSVTLTGTGTAPVVVLAPTTVTFPAQTLNTTSAPMNGILTNTGTTALHLATTNAVTIATPGNAPGDFAILPAGTTCANGTTVAQTNGTCTWSVTFTPTANGTRTATLIFTDDNNGVTGSTQTVTLTGTTPPAATLSPSTPITFGNQGVGTASSATTITMTNPGGSPLQLASTNAVAISGANAADFAVSTTGTTCTNGATVAPTQSCIINVTFTPGAAGARGPATLTLTDNAGGVAGSTQTVSLSGTGISFALSIQTPPPPTAAGQPIMVTIEVNPGTGGFPNLITFSASNLPPDSMGSFVPPTLTPGTALATSLFTLTTTARTGGSGSNPSRPAHGPLSGGWIATAMLALLAMLTLRRGIRMQRLAYLPLAVLLLSAAIITGCTTSSTGTPAGNYTVTVTATSGSYTQTTTIPVTVQ